MSGNEGVEKSTVTLVFDAESLLVSARVAYGGWSLEDFDKASQSFRVCSRCGSVHWVGSRAPKPGVDAVTYDWVEGCDACLAGPMESQIHALGVGSSRRLEAVEGLCKKVAALEKRVAELEAGAK